MGEIVGIVGIGLIVLFFAWCITSDIREHKGEGALIWGGDLFT